MRTPLGRLVAAALVLAAGATGQPAVAAAPDGSSARPQAPAVRLPHSSHGPRAVELLGDRLDAAAEVNDLSASGLRRLLLEDRSAWVDTTGQVYFQDPAPELADAPSAAPALTAAAEDTFLLHSKPGSRRVIFLDFDGAVVSGTLWNDSDGVRAGFHPAWTLDGDPTTFTTTERATIQSVWQRVAEDYAPFDVDVTTQDPGAAAIERSGTGDLAFGTRALVSPSADALAAICGGRCGGVAYLDVFDTPSSHAATQPAWVFPQTLGDDPKAIAEAVAHEVGHTLGLEHDGTPTLGYYGGHGSWAPIMGGGFERPISQWSRGDYSGASRQEDDLAIIAAGGAPVRADEAGGTVAAAADALPSGSAYITRRTDVDVYELGACSGPVTVDARPAPTSPNLDIELTLLTAAGAALATDDPLSTRVNRNVATGLSAAVTRTLPTGNYFVAVDGVGNGTAVTGYDDYGSLGAYTLELTDGSCDAASRAPSAPQGLTTTPAADGRSVAVTWTPPATDGGSPVTGYTATRSGAAPATLPADATEQLWVGLEPGTSYAFTVAATNAVGTGAATSGTVTTPGPPPAPTTVAPSAARIGRAVSGARGGRVTATATWRAPSSDGGAPVSGYQVHGYRLAADGRVLGTYRSARLAPGVRSVSLRLPTAGTWRFAVRARNSVGYGTLSARSNLVRGR